MDPSSPPFDREVSLQGKIALITGSTAGIGEQLALELAKRGATVVIAARNTQKAEAVYADIKERNPHAKVEMSPPLDTSSVNSVQQFAKWWRASKRPIHILVNNAGAAHAPKHFNSLGVPYLCQTNYLGPYILTRLLEKVLLRTAQHEQQLYAREGKGLGGCRVVHTSSLLHRMGTLGDDVKRDFLQGIFGHSYPNTKLANCLFGYELQRRLGAYGVQSCVVDPGSVNTNIWASYPSIFRHLLSYIYAPSAVGVKPLLFACTVDWNDPAAAWAGSREPTLVFSSPAAGEGEAKKPVGLSSIHTSRRSRMLKPYTIAAEPQGPLSLSQQQQQQQEDLSFFAPEAFTWPILTWYSPQGSHGPVGRWFMKSFMVPVTTPMGLMKQALWTVVAAAVSLINWPLQQLSAGLLLGKVRPGLSSPLSYDHSLAAELWDASADVAGLPREISLD